jgi:hypothetical protein
MRTLIALVCTLALAGPGSREDEPKGAKGEHVSITVRCDPAVVQPGGWVDVVIDYVLESGWHTTSPCSKAGQPTALDLALPEGWNPSGRVRATQGRIVHDETFGDVEQVSGRGEIRRRLRVPAKAEEENRTLDGSLTIVVCDFERCLPPQALAFRVPLDVNAKEGLRGPQLDDELAAEPNDGIAFQQQGCLVRVRADPDVASPGEEFLLVMDVAMGPDTKATDFSLELTGLDPVSSVGNGWNAVRRPMNTAEIHDAPCFSHIQPVRLSAKVEGTELKFKAAVTIQKPSKQKAWMHFSVPLRIER